MTRREQMIECAEQMDNAVAKYKIEKLQAEIRRLNGED